MYYLLVSHCGASSCPDMAMQSAGRFSNETLSRVVHALGDLKYHDEMVLDALTRNLIDSMDNMNDTQLHDLVCSWMRM